MTRTTHSNTPRCFVGPAATVPAIDQFSNLGYFVLRASRLDSIMCSTDLPDASVHQVCMTLGRIINQKQPRSRVLLVNENIASVYRMRFLALYESESRRLVDGFYRAVKLGLLIVLQRHGADPAPEENPRRFERRLSLSKTK